MDLDHDLFCALHTPNILNQKIRLLAKCGFKRLYIVAPPPGQPDYAVRIAPQDGPPNFLRQSRAALGDDPLRLAMKYAKAAGFEVFIVFKPYEGGGVFTVPHGFVPPCGRNWLETLGGRAVGLDPFIIEHPEFLLARKPYDALLSQDVARIEMVFVLDYIDRGKTLRRSGRKWEWGDKPDYPPLDVRTVIGDYPADNFQIYTSRDNGSYELYSKHFQVSERIEKRLIRHANGKLIFNQPVNCRIIELSGLEIDSPYFAVSFSGDPNAFRTIPYSRSCFKVFSSKQQELPVTVSPRLRDTVLTGKTSFPERGFEFEEIGPYYGDSGWRTCLLYGFARGKLRRLRGSLCEAYPQVRTHWLNQIKRFIELGCDGVDIRLVSHCSSVTDFVNYGFNPPLVKAYQERYGINILERDPDPVKMMKLRGEFFMKFVKKAAALLHQRGLTLQMHLNHCQLDPTIDTTYFCAGFWSMPKVVPDWRRVVDIADEITIKDFNFGGYDPNRSGAIKDLTAALGKPLWVHCYLQQGNDLNPEFLKAVEADSRITGLLLYEVATGIVRVDPATGRVSIGPDEELPKLLIHQPD